MVIGDWLDEGDGRGSVSAKFNSTVIGIRVAVLSPTFNQSLITSHQSRLPSAAFVQEYPVQSGGDAGFGG